MRKMIRVGGFLKRLGWVIANGDSAKGTSFGMGGCLWFGQWDLILLVVCILHKVVYLLM